MGDGPDYSSESISSVKSSISLARNTLLALWIIGIALFSYGVLWLGSHDEALRIRAVDGLRRYCKDGQVYRELFRLYHGGVSQGSSADSYQFLDPWHPECNTATLAIFAGSRTCADSIVFSDSSRCIGDINYIKKYLADLRDVGKRSMLNRVVDIPFTAVKSTVIDYILISPLFCLCYMYGLNWR